MKILDVIAFIFVLIGGITWGTIGFFDWNFIDFFFTDTYVDIIIYDIVGVSAVYSIIRAKGFFSSGKSCNSGQ